MTMSAADHPPERERERIVGRAGVVGVGTLFSRLLGFARDAVIAALFPLRDTDVFWAALAIPTAFRGLFAEGAVSSAVVPVLSERLATGGDEAARAFFARARGISLIALLVTTVLGIVFAPALTSLFAGGYSDSDKLTLTTTMTRVMFPYLFFLGTAALGLAALNAKGRFAVAAFAPALFNVGIVAAAFGLRGVFAAHGIEPSLSIAIGATVGGALQVVAQLPALRKLGYLSRPILDLSDPHVRAMLRRIGPMAFGLGVYYIQIALSRRFLSEMGDGRMSYFNWGARLCDLPQGIFVMAISSATLPSLATFAAKGELDELVTTWSHGMRLALFVAVPCSVAFIAIGEPIVALVFERGHFSSEASHETARALAWQGGAIFSGAAARQLVPAFYALGDTRTPVIVSVASLVAFVVLSYLLSAPLGHVGISIGVAGSSVVQTTLLAFAFRRRMGRLNGGEIARSAGKVVIASAVAAIVSAVVATFLVRTLPGRLGRSLPGVVAIIAFGVLFVVSAKVLRARELHEMMAPIRRRLGRR
jgi:putative peptidoglycan lipid II flippase